VPPHVERILILSQGLCGSYSHTLKIEIKFTPKMWLPHT
jgi:hypothetical protein